MSERTPITAPAAPAAVGPYSQAIRHGDLIFCSVVAKGARVEIDAIAAVD